MSKFNIDTKTLEEQLSRQLERKLKELRRSTHGTPVADLTEDGAEIPDSTPIVIHVRDGKLTDFNAVRSFMNTHLSRAAEEAGMETIEDANDFDIPDDIELPNTPYEVAADQAEEDRRVIEARVAQVQLSERVKRVGSRRPKAREKADPVDGSGTPKASVLKEGQED